MNASGRPSRWTSPSPTAATGRGFPEAEFFTGREQVKRLERTAQRVLLRRYTPAAVISNRAFEIQ